MLQSPRLHPVTEFTAADLGRQVNELIDDGYMQAMLSGRHFMDVLARHSGEVEASIASMEHARKIHAAGEMAILAVVADSGNVVGMATADTALPLNRISRMAHRLPPGMLGWPLLRSIKGYSPNIAAWTAEALIPRESPPLLTQSYRELAAPSGPGFRAFARCGSSELDDVERVRQGRFFNPWAVEPGFRNSPVQLAFEKAGLEYQDTGWFDDGEDRHHAVPYMTLYARKAGRMNVS